MREDTSVRVSQEHAKELRLLKIAWEKQTIDEVLEELIKPRRHEQVGVLQIEMLKEQRED